MLTVLTGHTLGRALSSPGLAGPQPWPNGREFMTMYDAFYHQLAAQRTWTRRRPLLFTHVTRDRGICQGIDADDKWSRLSHLGSSESVLHERAAAVHAAAEHHVTALVHKSTQSLTLTHSRVGDHAHGAGMIAIDTGDNARVRSPMNSEQTDQRRLDCLFSEHFAWVLLTARERSPTHRASQWSPVERDPHRDTT